MDKAFSNLLKHIDKLTPTKRTSLSMGKTNSMVVNVIVVNLAGRPLQTHDSVRLSKFGVECIFNYRGRNLHNLIE